jgi:NagD protein
MQACLVLTGSTRLEDLGNYVYQPTCILGGVEDLLEELKGAGTTNGKHANLRPTIPILPERNRGLKHPHKRADLGYPRPRPAMTK